MNSACVKLKFSDGSMITIDIIAVDNDVADNIYQYSELDWLIYNKLLEYHSLCSEPVWNSMCKVAPEHRLMD